ncbi:MAG TPA: TetR/AcrR family transcriptional regulator [Solirubrobacteraceae bacterium]|jgi:AcrR family transcriptional regulator|nr:TetR/AcrR family transcriptional regulator [Solirubrobacteraceae bacterium]
MSSLEIVDRNSRFRPSIEPIYDRLPRGPHHLGRDGVVRNQRMRIHGAMVEAVAAHGYEGATVKRVIGLAGVSRRAFYEQFTDKRSCFIGTCDLIAARWLKRVDNAFREAKGDLRTRTRTALRTFVDEIVCSPKSAHMVMVDSLAIGPEGPVRLRRVSVAFERLLRDGYANVGGCEMPASVARGIVGGIQRATYLHLVRERESGPRAVEAQALAREMLRWTMFFHPSSNPRVESVIRARSAPEAEPHEDFRPVRPEDRRPSGPKARLLDSVLRLAASEPYEDVGPVRIADEANVSLDAFLELFKGRDDCFMSAFEMIGDELLAIAADPSLVGPEWEAALPCVISALMEHLAEHPVYAQTIATSVYAAGETAVERSLQLALDLTSVLTEGAPGLIRASTLNEWIAGAIWQTVQTYGTPERARMLPALTAPLTQIVLTPFLGVNATQERLAGTAAATL